MGRILAWTPSLTGGIVVVRDPCLHGRFSIGSLCVGPSDTMSWSPTIGLLITPQEPIQPRLGGRVERFLNTFRTEVVKNTAKQLVVVDVVGLPVQLHVSLNGDVRRLLVRDKERLEGYGSQGGRPPLAIDCPLPRRSSLFSLKCTRGYLGYDGPDR